MSQWELFSNDLPLSQLPVWVPSWPQLISKTLPWLSFRTGYSTTLISWIRFRSFRLQLNASYMCRSHILFRAKLLTIFPKARVSHPEYRRKNYLQTTFKPSWFCLDFPLLLYLMTWGANTFWTSADQVDSIRLPSISYDLQRWDVTQGRETSLLFHFEFQ